LYRGGFGERERERERESGRERERERKREREREYVCGCRKTPDQMIDVDLQKLLRLGTRGRRALTRRNNAHDRAGTDGGEKGQGKLLDRQTNVKQLSGWLHLYQRVVLHKHSKQGDL
jgi:hypothetical protein